MIRALLVFIVGTLIIACTTSTEPQHPTIDHACDREKVAVWSALGHNEPPPATLMAQGEWNIPESPRGLQSETYYFMVQVDFSCRVLRA